MPQHHTVDARNLLCPMPLLRLQQASKSLPKGDTITIICTDPGVEYDIPAWCRIHEHTIIKGPERQGHPRHEITLTIQL